MWLSPLSASNNTKAKIPLILLKYLFVFIIIINKKFWKQIPFLLLKLIYWVLFSFCIFFPFWISSFSSSSIFYSFEFLHLFYFFLWIFFLFIFLIIFLTYDFLSFWLKELFFGVRNSILNYIYSSQTEYVLFSRSLHSQANTINNVTDLTINRTTTKKKIYTAFCLNH